MGWSPGFRFRESANYSNTKRSIASIGQIPALRMKHPGFVWSRRLMR